MDVEQANKTLDHYVIAGREDTPVRLLFELAQHHHHKVRLRVAENLAATPSILKRLSYDENYDIRVAVAANPRCPRRLACQIARDPDVILRHGVAQEIGVPRPILEILAEDENAWVKGEALKTLAVLDRNKQLAEGGDELAIRREHKQHLASKLG